MLLAPFPPPFSPNGREGERERRREGGKLVGRGGTDKPVCNCTIIAIYIDMHRERGRVSLHYSICWITVPFTLSAFVDRWFTLAVKTLIKRIA